MPTRTMDWRIVAAWIVLLGTIAFGKVIGRSVLPSWISTAMLVAPQIIWALFSPIVVWLSSRMPPTRLRARNLAAHLAAAFALSFAFAGLLHLFFERRELFYFTLHGSGAIIVGFLIYVSMAAAASLSAERATVERSQLLTIRADQEALVAKLKAVRSSIPWTLVSSAFAGIAKLSSANDTAGASRLLRTFADYLRGLLDGSRGGDWSVAREVELMRAHAAVLQALPGGGRSVSVEASQCAAPAPVRCGSIDELTAPLLDTLPDPSKASISIDDAVETRGFTVSVTVDGKPYASLAAEPPHDGEHATAPSIDRSISETSAPSQSLALIVAFAAFAASIGFGLIQRYDRSGALHPIDLLLFMIRMLVPVAIAFSLSRWMKSIRSADLQLGAAVVVTLASAFAGQMAMLLFAHYFLEWPDPMSSRGLAVSLTSLGPTTINLFAILMILQSSDAARARASIALTHARAEKGFAVARLELLQSQLQPHFLFNALNSVGTLLRLDPQAAASMVDRLRSYYAKNLTLTESRIITLEEELAAIRDYLEIERVRFGARLETRLSIDPATEGGSIPALLLQPVVENAIKHGVATHGGQSFVEISTRANGGRMTILVANACRADGRSGTDTRAPRGLANVRAQLDATFAGDYDLRLELLEDRAEVRIDVPLRRLATVA